MSNSGKTVKVICVQYEPKFKDIKYNIEKLEKMFERYSEKDEIDIVVFPEMTLSGYVFENLEDIKPYISYYDKGEQFDYYAIASWDIQKKHMMKNITILVLL